MNLSRTESQLQTGTGSPSELIIKEDSLFDVCKGKSVAVFQIENKLYRVSFSQEETPSFIKPLYSTLNPLQGVFYMLLSHRYREKPFSSLVLSPTSSGKTGIIILYIHHMLQLFRSEKNNSAFPIAVYTAPLKALIREKYEEFKKVFGNDSVEMRTGDNYSTKDLFITKEILLCTPDYLSLVIRNKIRFVKNIRFIVVDEIHTLFNSEDKPALDEVLWYIKENNIPYLALSATIPLINRFIEYNPPDVVIKSNWSPVPVEKHYFNISEVRNKEFDPHTCPFVSSFCIEKCPFLKTENKNPEIRVKTTEEEITLALKLVLLTLKNTDIKKIIVFVPSKREGWLLLEKLDSVCRFDLLNEEESLPFSKCKDNRKHLFAAFHCADLEPKERSLIENRFRTDQNFPVLIATHTLAYGINLPADASIVCVRNIQSQNFVTLWPSLIDCIQMGGRAGRFGFSKKGYVFYFILNKKTYNQTAHYLQFPETYPFEEFLNQKDLDTVICNSIFLCIDRNRPVTDCLENSFFLHAGKVKLLEVIDVLKKLKEMGFVAVGEKSGYRIDERGKFCFFSNVSPFSLFFVEMFIDSIDLNKTDPYSKSILRFLSSIPFSGSTYESTLKTFLREGFSHKFSNTVYDIDAIIDRYRNYLPSWHMLNRLLPDGSLALFFPRNVFLVSGTLKTVIRDMKNVVSFLFQITGTYYICGLPKLCADLAYISPSTIIYYIRNLTNLSFSLGYYSVPEAFVFAHMLKYRVPLHALPLVLFAKKNMRDFGQVRSNILNLVLQEMSLTSIKLYDLFCLKKTLAHLKEQILNRKEEYMDNTLKTIKIHLKNRILFKKETDSARIEKENLLSLAGLLDILRKSKMEEIDEAELYDPFIMEVFKRAINLKTKSKEEILNAIKIEVVGSKRTF